MSKPAPESSTLDTLTLEADCADLSGQDGQAELLRTLHEQEARIQQLEERLAALQNDDNRVVSRSAVPEAQLVKGRESGALAMPATRCLLAEQDGDNVMIELNARITTIGREPDNDIQVRSRFVSRNHARIVNRSNGTFCEDLASRNGVYINNRRVDKAQLRSGDYIRIGRIRLRYIDIMEDHGLSGRA